MSAKVPRCAERTPAGACLETATQRLVKPSFITHRCAKHRVAKAAAKRDGWTVVAVTEQEVTR